MADRSDDPCILSRGLGDEPVIDFLLGNWSRLLIYGVVIASALGVTWMHGLFTGRAALHEYKGEQATEAVKIIVKRGAVTERVIIRYVKVKGDTLIVRHAIEKEVVRYEQANPGYCLDPDWRRLHDRSALNAVSGGAGGAAGEGGAPPAATALKTVTENYAACHRTADRLDALQDWIREQEKVTP